MKKILAFAFLAALFVLPGQALAKDVVKLGFNIPLTGDIPKVGEASKYAAEIVKEEVNKAGGLEVGGKKYMLEFVYQDNESKPESAVAAQLKLITQDEVLGIVGPQSSKQAVPAGEVANENETPMISPWSTNPATTKDRPFVFRAAFLDPFQAPVAANFAAKTFNAKTAAVIFDLANDYSKGLAEDFKAYFEKKFGAGSVKSFESHGTQDQDFSGQLTKIIATKPDFIFVPDNYNQVALIIKQARDLGYKGPFMGADAWGSAELMPLCGDVCKGQYFSTHYTAKGAKGKTKEFIDKYKAKYGYEADDVAALTYDSIYVMLSGLKNAGKLTGDVAKDRKALKDGMRAIKQFDGITGKMKYGVSEDNTPEKCAVVVKISDAGEFEFTESVCP
ncbi:MAG: ABC transporter substrate-binding protein [Thermodesulfobacteriota bacterium]